MLNRSLRHGLLILSTTVVASSSVAETVSLEYVGFYDRLKQVNKQNYQLVELAFSVPVTTDCTITSGSITTENETYPLTYTDQQRLFIPYDAQLKSDRGLVNIEVAGNASKCAIAMQVRARSTQQQYTQAELLALNTDMNRLLDGLQGFPMKYFRKPIDGITFEFLTADTTITIDDAQQLLNGKFTLTLDQMNHLKQISFSEKPNVVSPYVNNQ
ncbi:DUF2987 domain-containing protein [Shewanella ulleungensis]|jgi:hypothetical protein|uniref:DUF2987 domain-containing protein n=1 Tax=Shewanella ulleungensis TaxID=2282699 RepID=A0ABQ2QEM3_9GAMM|nr:DUF2987 domain-containing protein [Shewanella ulleungensis]MCL1148821.1 DUF2987 domain-containing protein [Shewanella ulleungensis]GGP75406.1 hypothetical protein GCM10009410_04410 [Shewanella ulleungensis]